jgi:hypothetical protein
MEFFIVEVTYFRRSRYFSERFAIGYPERRTFCVSVSGTFRHGAPNLVAHVDPKVTYPCKTMFFVFAVAIGVSADRWGNKSGIYLPMDLLEKKSPRA